MRRPLWRRESCSYDASCCRHPVLGIAIQAEKRCTGDDLRLEEAGCCKHTGEHSAVVVGEALAASQGAASACAVGRASARKARLPEVVAPAVRASGDLRKSTHRNRWRWRHGPQGRRHWTGAGRWRDWWPWRAGARRLRGRHRAGAGRERCSRGWQRRQRGCRWRHASNAFE